MNKHIVCFALRRLILESGFSITDQDREDAITELIRIEREDANKVGFTGEQMRSFREYRKANDRIPTIKEIRRVLNVGLAEALIIVKGIESHDGIIT